MVFVVWIISNASSSFTKFSCKYDSTTSSMSCAFFPYKVNCLLLVVLRITPFGLPYMIFWSNGVVFLQNFNSSVVQAQNDILSYQNHSINLSSSNSVR